MRPQLCAQPTRKPLIWAAHTRTCQCLPAATRDRLRFETLSSHKHAHARSLTFPSFRCLLRLLGFLRLLGCRLLRVVALVGGASRIHKVLLAVALFLNSAKRLTHDGEYTCRPTRADAQFNRSGVPCVCAGAYSCACVSERMRHACKHGGPGGFPVACSVAYNLALYDIQRRFKRL